MCFNHWKGKKSDIFDLYESTWVKFGPCLIASRWGTQNVCSSLAHSSLFTFMPLFLCDTHTHAHTHAHIYTSAHTHTYKHTCAFSLCLFMTFGLCVSFSILFSCYATVWVTSIFYHYCICSHCVHFMDDIFLHFYTNFFTGLTWNIDGVIKSFFLIFG